MSRTALALGLALLAAGCAPGPGYDGGYGGKPGGYYGGGPGYYGGGYYAPAPRAPVWGGGWGYRQPNPPPQHWGGGGGGGGYRGGPPPRAASPPPGSLRDALRRLPH